MEQVESVQHAQKGSITIVPLWGHSENSRKLIKQTMEGTKAVRGIFEQVGSVQRAQEGFITIISLWGHPKSTD